MKDLTTVEKVVTIQIGLLVFQIVILVGLMMGVLK